MSDQTKAANRDAPYKFAADTNSSVRRIATDATGGDFALPSGWAGQWVTMKQVSGNVRFAFTDGTAETIDYAEANSADPQLGWHLGAGESEDWLIPADATHLTWDGSGAGELLLCLTSGSPRAKS